MKYSIFLSASLAILIGVYYPMALPFVAPVGSHHDLSLQSNHHDAPQQNPIAACQNLSLQLDTNGQLTIDPQDVDNGSTASGNLLLSLSDTTFDCSDIGQQIVTLTVSSHSTTLSASCTATVMISDNTAPHAACQPLVIHLDAQGEAHIAASTIDAGSSDACGIDDIKLNKYQFGCADVDTFPKVVQLTVTDVSGNTAACQALVKVNDQTAPHASCQNHTVYLPASGGMKISASDIDNASSDACGVVFRSMDRDSFTCADVSPFSKIVELTVSDISGNTATCQALVKVKDQTDPFVACHNLTLNLDVTGGVKIAVSDINNASTDACGLQSISIDRDSFNCADVSQFSKVVNLQAIDVHGNDANCQGLVLIQDELAPDAICQDISVYLDANGAYSLSASEIDNGSSDNCAIDLISIPPSTFDCSSLPRDVQLKVIDIHGNKDSCIAQVSPIDSLAPIAHCKSVTVALDAQGHYLLSPSEINDTSEDNCGAGPLSLAVNPSSFSCADISNNPNAVTLSVTDASGNTASCQAHISLIDTTAPSAFCLPLTLYLDSQGMASISPSDINNQSSDACGINNLAISKSNFDCADLVLPNQTITLSVTDIHANSSTCQANIQIRDSLKPIVQCLNITVYLDNLGQASIVQSDIGTAQDNCAIENIALSKSAFTCIELGLNHVTFAAKDSSNNVGFCNATVNVQDSISPEIRCPLDMIVAADAACQAILPDFTNQVSPSDNCSTMPSVSQFPLVNSLLMDTSIITLTANDGNGNRTNCDFRFIVVDESPPSVTCKNIILPLDVTGNAMITIEDVMDGRSDNCTPSSQLAMSLSRDQFDCDDLGPQPVRLQAVDLKNNTDSCEAIVTVVDEISPTAQCPSDLTFEIGTIAPLSIDVDAMSRDNCSISDLRVSPPVLFCENVAMTLPVHLILTDQSGNTDSCLVNVSVIDSSESEWIFKTPIIVRCGEQLIDWNEPIASFPCGRMPDIRYRSEPAGLVKEGIFPVGSTQIFYELEDELVSKSLLHDFEIEILPIPMISNFVTGDVLKANANEALEIAPEASVNDVAYIWEVQLSDNLSVDPLPPTGITPGPISQLFSFNDARSVGEAVYSITPVFADSCIGEKVEILVKVLPGSQAFFIPEMFTPNGDGVNDDWGVRLLSKGNPDDYRVKVFNKSGGLMFSAISLDTRWKAGSCPDGPYWYIIERKDTGERLKSGAVTVQR